MYCNGVPYLNAGSVSGPHRAQNNLGASVINGLGEYSGGDVMNVLFGILLGGMSLGQAAPNLSAFASARVAAAKIFAVIDRVPAVPINSPDAKVPAKIEGTIEVTRTKHNRRLQDVRFKYKMNGEERNQLYHVE